MFLLLFASGEVFAQRIVIDAIEISSSPLTGESKLSSYSGFLANTQNPALFRTQNSSELSRTNKTIKTGFEIDFIFRLKSKPTHQFITGFEASSLTPIYTKFQGLTKTPFLFLPFLTPKPNSFS